MKDTWENWARLIHQNRIYEAIEMRKRIEELCVDAKGGKT